MDGVADDDGVDDAGDDEGVGVVDGYLDNYEISNLNCLLDCLKSQSSELLLQLHTAFFLANPSHAQAGLYVQKM